MKRILSITAVAGLLATAPAFAGIDVFVEFVTPAPVYVTPAPVYVTRAPVYVSPASYRHWEPRRHRQHEHVARRHHHGHHIYRDRH